MAENEERKRAVNTAVEDLVTIYRRLDKYITTLKKYRDNPDQGTWEEDKTNLRNFLYNSSHDFDAIRTSLK